jgi:hypothetical protein
MPGSYVKIEWGNERFLGFRNNFFVDLRM